MTGEALLGRNLHMMDALEERVSQVICQLPLRGPDGTYLIPDEALRVTTMTAQAGSKALWRLACAARAEIVRRISERAPDPTVLRKEVAREAHEQSVSVRVFRRDAEIGQVYGPLFAEPDTAPDLDRSFYTVAMRSPDPIAALQVAQQYKDENPLYSTSDFESYIAATRMVSPLEGYGESYVGCAALAFISPYWDGGVLEATEKAMDLPLRRWLLPDAIVLLHIPPRALDLGCRILSAHDLRYQQCVFLPRSPFCDGNVWHAVEMLLIATRGHLRLPDVLPGEWRDPQIERCISLYFPLCLPKLVVYPRRGMEMGGGWVRPEDLPPHVF